MRLNNIHIAAIGARTPVGLSAESSAAAVRAGVVSISEHPFMTDSAGEPMSVSRDTFINAYLLQTERLIALASSAIEEVCKKLLPLKGKIRHISLIIGLPEERPGWDAVCKASFKREIERGNFSLNFKDVDTIIGGHCAGLMAIEEGARRIQDNKADVCIAGGVDSYLDPDTLVWLDDNRQLVGKMSRSGFIPGEGAGFCAVVSSAFLYPNKIHSLAQIATFHTAQETKLIKSDAICLAEGLSEAIVEAIQGLNLPADVVGGVLCDINGERYRSEEWGFAILKTAHAFANPNDYDCPASSWGDVGAASGPLFGILAVRARQRGYDKGDRYMLWTSSESGNRSAMILELGLPTEKITSL